jgi:lipoprotein signal peptidase
LISTIWFTEVNSKSVSSRLKTSPTVAIVFLVCLAVLLFGHPSVDEQRWLQSAVTLILGAAVGAAFRKS